jgi:hypothetical protein
MALNAQNYDLDLLLQGPEMDSKAKKAKARLASRVLRKRGRKQGLQEVNLNSESRVGPSRSITGTLWIQCRWSELDETKSIHFKF